RGRAVDVREPLDADGRGRGDQALGGTRSARDLSRGRSPHLPLPTARVVRLGPGAPRDRGAGAPGARAPRPWGAGRRPPLGLPRAQAPALLRATILLRRTVHTSPRRDGWSERQPPRLSRDPRRYP